MVANAIRQQEVDVRILQSQPLGGLAILGEKAARQTRQQIGRGMRQPVGQTQHVAQARNDAGLRAHRRHGHRAAMKVIAGVRMHQERRPAVQISAHQLDALLGLGPGLHHHVLQFLVQKLFGGLLKLRIHFDEIGQHAHRLQIAGLPLVDGIKEPLHALGGVGAMGDDIFERIPASLQARRLLASLFQLLARFAGLLLMVRQRRFHLFALVAQRLQLHLPRRQLGGDLGLDHFQALKLARRCLFVARQTLAIAGHPGELRLHLRQLILQRRGFAQ